MGFITGMMGPYMGPISFFVPAALVVSLWVAVVVTPFIASHMLGGPDTQHPVGMWFGKGMEYVTEKYHVLLSAILYKRALQKKLLRGALLLFVVSLLLPAGALVHFQMLPKADRDQFYVYIDLPVDTNTETTKAFSDTVTELILGDADVLSVQEYVARAPIVDFNGMFKGAQQRSASFEATLRVNIRPAADRARSSTDVATDVRAMVMAELAGGGNYVRFMEEPPGPPVQATLVAKVSSLDPDLQKDAAHKFWRMLENVPGVVDMYSSEEESVGQVQYLFDYEAATRLGVPVSEARLAFEFLNGPFEVAEFMQTGHSEFVSVFVTTQAPLQNSPSDVYNTVVTSTNGSKVSLGSVVQVAHTLRPARADFDGSKQVTYVTAEAEDRSIVYVMIDVMRAIHSGHMAGYEVFDWNLFGMELVHTDTHTHVQLIWGGEWEMTLENFRDLGIAMGVALLLVYGVLVAQYKRFATPAYILVTVPLGLVGILWGFLLLDSGFGIYLTATALIGFIALIGIVVNNAIIFLEYVTQQQANGFSYRESLLSAGKARVRPILLTSLTTVLGSLTIAGDPVWSGLAWAIVFGLSLSTVLTLVIYPTLLVYFNVTEH
jgi:multidrug efflux pump subunit AcrB